ncbi:DUF1573 domain-containing protein, partial [Candidatus Omnitrophota bacterium]
MHQIIKRIFLIVLFVLVAGTAFAGPRLAYKTDYFDLGTLEEGRVFPFLFRIKSIGDADLIVDVIRVSCGCVRITEPTEEVVLAPGEELAIHFTFDTTGFRKEVIKYIYVETNDPRKPVFSVKVRVDVAPKEEVFLQRFEKFSGWTVVGAGL